MRSVSDVATIADAITQKRLELKELEKQFRSLLPRTSVSPSHIDLDHNPMSVIGIMRHMLVSNPGKTVSISDFMKAMPSGTAIRSVRSMACRLAATSQGRIIANRRGGYKFIGS